MELIFWILIQNSNKLLYLSYFIEQNYLIVGFFLPPRMLLLYCCLLQAKKSGGEQRMCWCLRENSKGGTILSCWLRTIHIYCNLKYACVFVCAHAHVCVAWTCWCEQNAHMCVHVMMTETGISYCSPFLSTSISWCRISHGTWSSLFGSGYLVPKSPRSTRVATSPLFSTGVTVSVLAFIWVLRARSQMLLVVQQTLYPWSQLPRPKYSYVWNEQFYL